MSLQLEENVQNVISAIITKYPKVETDLLYLRSIFIDCRQSLEKEVTKLSKKYQNAKQKLNQSPKHSQKPFTSTDPNLHTSSSKHQRIKSPLNIQKTPKDDSQTYDYSIDLMALIIAQARSIKTIFDSVMKRQASSSNFIQTSKLLNLYTVYKEFYKSFKQKHKEYTEEYSYDKRHIHKNSTTMKHRLLEELKIETQRRKELQHKLQALQEMMETSLLHKDKQLQKLNFQLVNLINKNFNGSKKFYSCPKCNYRISEQCYVSSDLSVQQEKKPKHENNHSDYILGSISRQKSSHSSKEQNDDNHHLLKVLFQKQLQVKPHQSSKFQQQNSKKDSDSDDEQYWRNSREQQKTKKSNIGRFYDRNKTVITGKINETQSLKGDNNIQNQYFGKGRQIQIDQERISSKKFQNEQRISFGATVNSQAMNQHPTNRTQINGLKQLQPSSASEKLLEQQIKFLKEQLKEQRYQKAQLQKKIAESEIDYKKLENEVNELYKMINDKQFTLSANQNTETDATYLKTQTTNHQYSFETEEKQVEKNKQKGFLNQNAMTKKKQIPYQQHNQNQPNQIKDFEDCEDYEQIIQKAEKTILNKTGVSPYEQDIRQMRINSNSNLDTISPIKEGVQKNHEVEMKNPLPSPRTGQSFKVQRLSINSPGEGKKTSLNQTQNIRLISGRQNQMDQRNLGKSPFAPNSKQRQDELKNQLDKMERFYDNKCKEKEQQLQNFRSSANKAKFQADELMMMLLLQSFSIQELMKKEEEYQDKVNHRNYFANDYI